MPPTQRSRACQQCRRRRVKCDETPGSCQTCTRLGLKCSGPLQGSVIIDMTDKVTKPRRRNLKEAKSSVAARKDSAIDTPTPKDAAPSRVNSPLDQQEPAASSNQQQLVLSPKARPVIKREFSPNPVAVADPHWRTKLPLLYQPAQADIYDHAFVSHFVELNQGVRTYSPAIPWLTYLPSAFPGIKQPALKLSIRAASMAFYAKVHRDIGILVESYRWYNISLHAQRRSLARFNDAVIPTDEDVLVPTILGLYEVYAGTTPTSVFQHLTAATKILEIRGPQKSSSGAAFPLFKGIRVSDSHKSLVFNRPSVFASPDWMTVPFVLEPKNAHQLLTDIILLIPECISLCRIKGSLGGCFSRPIPPNIDLKPAWERANHLLAELNHWADIHPHLRTVNPTRQVTTPDMRFKVEPSGSNSPKSPTLVLPDTFVALTAATYEATRLVLNLLIHKLQRTSAWRSQDAPTESQSPTSLLGAAISSSKSILQISEFFEKSHTVGFDFMRSTFPLVVVGILGPSEEDKISARQTLNRWGEKRGVGGLSGSWIDI